MVHNQQDPGADHISPIESPLSQPYQIIYSGTIPTLTPMEIQGVPNKTSGADHIIPVEPPLAQSSQTEDFGIVNLLTEGTSDGKERGAEDITYNPGQKEVTKESSSLENNSLEGNAATKGKYGDNYGWTFKQGWSRDRIIQHTGTKLPTSPVDIKGGVEEAPVVGGATKTKAENPTRSDKEPWTVILGQRKEKPQKRDPQTLQDTTVESTKSPDLRTEHTVGKPKDDTVSPTGDKPGPTQPLINRTRQTYNQVRL